MPHLALTLLLLAAPAEAATTVQKSPQPVERVAPEDPCEAAKRIAAQRPCLRAEDCGALQEWQRLYGAPRTEPLTPELANRQAIATSGRARAARQPLPVRQVPASPLCLAKTAPKPKPPAN